MTTLTDQLETYYNQGRAYGARSYNVSGEFLLSLLNRLKVNDERIKILEDALHSARIGQVAPPANRSNA